MNTNLYLITFMLAKHYESDAVINIIGEKIRMLQSKYRLNEVVGGAGYYFTELSDAEFACLSRKIEIEIEEDKLLKEYVKISYGKCNG